MYTQSLFNYHRRNTSITKVGDCIIGGQHHIVLQSMGNTDTNDTLASAAQAHRIYQAGGEIVRFTTQGKKEAQNIAIIRQTLHDQYHCDVPLVADVHFNASVAETAAETAAKVRINPGNFVTPQGTSSHYTTAQEKKEEEMIATALHRVIEQCKNKHVALRIGVNHGSLSPRMMFKHGDTPMGLVMSCIEFLELCQNEDFHNIVLSVKASNVVIMVETVRLLVEEMNKREMFYPLHLGVTEAGDGEDGRVKSAVGIGSLLVDGIGDTIRVSLSESPENEIPVAKQIANYTQQLTGIQHIDETINKQFNPFVYHKRESIEIDGIGGNNAPIVISQTTNEKADLTLDNIKHLPRIQYAELTPTFIEKLKTHPTAIILYSKSQHPIGEMRACFHRLMNEGVNVPVIIERTYDLPYKDLQIVAAIELGALFIDGFGNGIILKSTQTTDEQCTELALSILQATRSRMSKVEYIACPSCGRTMFDLTTTLQQIKQATAHLKAIKIGVMGCIVNGPGEMADADYGYVGAGRGKISLYKKQQCIEKNIPEEQAVQKLIELLKKDGIQ
ncbi:MAG: (E)-4-hydroxy-3-methylbut-2-enyl-diphosphate synthase [Bacteroidales bacterium]|nr:(E)-4-hydroxy-3-methylbut-2-enyl-diphosphate synthase [Bacteroidales bacterium]